MPAIKPTNKKPVITPKPAAAVSLTPEQMAARAKVAEAQMKAVKEAVESEEAAKTVQVAQAQADYPTLTEVVAQPEPAKSEKPFYPLGKGSKPIRNTMRYAK